MSLAALTRFHHRDRLSGGELGAHFRQIDVHDVRQLRLCVVADAHATIAGNRSHSWVGANFKSSGTADMVFRR